MKYIYFGILFFYLVTGIVRPCAYCQKKELNDTTALPPTTASAQADVYYFDAIKAKMHDDDRLAIELFEKFLTLKTNIPSVYYELSKLYNNAKNIDKAEEYIVKATDLDSKNKWYQEEYANVLTEHGDFVNAAKVMSKLADAEPQDIMYAILAAEYYEHAKNYKDAIKYLNKATVRNGADVEIQLRKVQLYLSLKDIDNAADILNGLITKDPKNGKYYKILGSIYDDNEQKEKADEIFDRGIRTIPEDPTIQLGIAEHYLKKGDTVTYKTFVKKAILNKEFDADVQLKLLDAYLQNLPNDSTFKLEGMPLIQQLAIQHPMDADLLAYYGNFIESENNRDSAIAIYKKSLAIKPANFNVWVRLLQNYSGKADADSLIKYSEKTIRLFPNQSLGNYYNGIGHMNKKEYPLAIKAINRAIDMQPETNPEILAAMYSTLGDIYNITQQYELSDYSFDKALLLQPNDASVLNNYSYYLSLRGKKLDVAEKMSKKSLEIRPEEATFLDTYGWILFKTGDYEKAKVYIEKAINKNLSGADATVYEHLGDVFYKLNNKDKAIDNWKIAKEKGSDNPLLDKKIADGKLYE